MPVRNEAGAAQPPVPKPMPTQGAVPVTNEEDSWDRLNTMADSTRTNADEGGFDRMNTNYFLKEGDNERLVFLGEAPYVFNAHSLTRVSQRGAKWYETVPCQKLVQGHCVYCTEGHPIRSYAGFPILDARGAYDKQAKTYLGGAPVPMIFLMSIPLAKLVQKMRAEVGGKFGNIVFEISRINKSYSLKPKMENTGGGNFKMVEMQQPYTGKVPNVPVVFTPDSDETAHNILLNTLAPAGKTATAPAASAQAAPAAAPAAGNGSLF